MPHSRCSCSLGEDAGSSGTAHTDAEVTWVPRLGFRSSESASILFTLLFAGCYLCEHEGLESIPSNAKGNYPSKQQASFTMHPHFLSARAAAFQLCKRQTHTPQGLASEAASSLLLCCADHCPGGVPSLAGLQLKPRPVYLLGD